MPRASRTRNQLSEEDKKKRRREQKKLSIRRARAKMNEADLKERNTENTCICAIHANNTFIIQALYYAKMIPYKFITDLLKSLCCNDKIIEFR